MQKPPAPNVISLVGGELTAT